MSWFTKLMGSIFSSGGSSSSCGGGGGSGGGCGCCSCAHAACGQSKLKRKCNASECSKVPEKKMALDDGNTGKDQGKETAPARTTTTGPQEETKEDQFVLNLIQLTKLLTEIRKGESGMVKGSPMEGVVSSDVASTANIQSSTPPGDSVPQLTVVATVASPPTPANDTNAGGKTPEISNTINSAATSAVTPATSTATPAATPAATEATTPAATQTPTPATTPAATQAATPAATQAATPAATPAGTPTETPAAGAASTTDTKAKDDSATTTEPAKPDTPPDPKLEKEKKEEEDFIKGHLVQMDGEKDQDIKPSETQPTPTTITPPSVSSTSSQKPWQGLDHMNLEKQVQFLQDNVVTPTKHRQILESCGGVLPKGIYFYGPGVDFWALDVVKALASEMTKAIGKRVNLFRKLPSDRFSKYGEGWKPFITSLFSAVEKNKPAIVLIENLDTFCNFCEYDIASNKDLVNRLSEEMDKITPGDVLVIVTVNDLKRSFPALRTSSRFQKYLEFPVTENSKSILSSLKLNVVKWNKDSCQDLQAYDLILKQIAEKISKVTPVLLPDDIAQLCRDACQKSILSQLSALDGKKTCGCQCALLNSAKWPDLPMWEEVLDAFVELRKAGKPLDKYASILKEVQPDNHLEDTLSFDKVGGLEKQIEILKENIIVPLRNKTKLKELGWGVDPVRGFIFHGPPGTGKTLLGKTLAAELGRIEGNKFSFIYHKGTECHGMYVGQTEGKLRDIFENAKKNKPAIIFMDEIDGLCEIRSDSGNSRFYNGVVTTILGLMDNLPRGQVFVIAATNRLSALDPALRRPGRFDKCIEFQAPKLEGRKNILDIHTSSWKQESRMGPQFLELMAQKTAGYTGADLEQLCRQAFVFAMRRHVKNVPGQEKQAEIDEARPRIEEAVAVAAVTPPKEDDALANLVILEQDWNAALRVVKSSGTNHFGNAVISDKPIPKPAITALENKIADITNKLSYFLEDKETSAGGSGMLTFLIWGTGPKQQKVIDKLLIPSLLGSKAFSGTVAAKLDVEMTEKEMASVINHVTNPGDDKLGILYIQGVDQLLDPRLVFMDGGLAVRGLHREFLEKLEILRGERVLILGTAGKKPSRMSQEIQALFRDMEDSRRYEFKGPSQQEIRTVFTEISSKIPSSSFEDIVKMLEVKDSDQELAKKNVSVYDLLDFKGEIDSVLKSIENKDGGVPAENVMTDELAKIINAFATYLESQEKNKTSLGGMYT